MGYVTREMIDRAKKMDLLTYLQTYEPQELVHFGGNTYCTREHDSLKISNTDGIATGERKSDDGKELCTMNEYRVIITETLKRAVTVEAESREEAEEAVRRQYQNSEHILVAEDFDGVSFSAQYPEQQVELPYGKMKELFRKAERAGTHVCGYITFMQDCFTVQYSERSRTYAVSSGNKAFQPNMGGYSVYGSCLDGTDPCVRLEQYMAVERGGEKGWSVERCYMLREDYDRVMALPERGRDRER